MSIDIIDGYFRIKRRYTSASVISDNMVYDENKIQFISTTWRKSWNTHTFKIISDEISTITFTKRPAYSGNRLKTTYTVYPKENEVRITQSPGDSVCIII